ncbi:unnamed protein product, partial [Mesorhabditis spiculigera]
MSHNKYNSGRLYSSILGFCNKQHVGNRFVMQLALPLIFGLFGWLEARISCKGLDGQNVDWFVAYKLPQGVNGSDGRSFIYADGKNSQWTQSKKLISDENSAIAATISQIYRQDESAFRFAYSDDGPATKSDGYRGHAKGVLNFDSSTGFWLLHSVPNYPPIGSYSYPQTGVKFAQSFVCITAATDALNEIGDHLRYIQSNPFNIGLPEKFAAKYPILRTIAQKKSLPTSTVKYTLNNQLTTVNGAKFFAFAKHKKFDKDLWHDLIVPTTRASFGVQSWLNGGSDDLGSTCTSEGNVYDIDEINLLGTKFSSSKDHSKWAVSDDVRVPMVCIGDLNRQRPTTLADLPEYRIPRGAVPDERDLTRVAAER